MERAVSSAQRRKSRDGGEVSGSDAAQDPDGKSGEANAGGEGPARAKCPWQLWALVEASFQRSHPPPYGCAMS